MQTPTEPQGYGSSYEKGVALEQRVATAYRLLGANPVQTNIRLAGHQLDLYVEILGADGFSTRIGIECKNYSRSLGTSVRSIRCLPAVRLVLSVVSSDSEVSTI